MTLDKAGGRPEGGGRGLPGSWGAPSAVFHGTIGCVNGAAHLRELNTKLKTTWPNAIKRRMRDVAVLHQFRGEHAVSCNAGRLLTQARKRDAADQSKGSDAITWGAAPLSVGRAAVATAKCLLCAPRPSARIGGGDPAINRAFPQRHRTESIILLYFNL